MSSWAVDWQASLSPNRLSANPNISVAVIEAGASGYADAAKFSVPAANLYDSSVGTQYDWQWQTTPQSGLAGRSAPWPRGKVLGGSSAINGLYYVRPSDTEQNAWSDLIADDAWNWDQMFAAMKKSESFTAPNAATTRTVNVGYNPASHGTDGPLHVSYPLQTYPEVGAFIESATNVGIPASSDPNAGNNTGVFLATSNINPANATRSFSRTAYLDPVAARPNLSVLTGHTVTRVVFNSTQTDEAASVCSSLHRAGRPCPPSMRARRWCCAAARSTIRRSSSSAVSATLRCSTAWASSRWWIWPASGTTCKTTCPRVSSLVLRAVRPCRPLGSRAMRRRIRTSIARSRTCAVRRCSASSSGLR